MASHIALKATAAAMALGGFVSIPLLSVATTLPPASCDASASTDGSPTIEGTSTLTQAELRAWWDRSGRGQPVRLAADIGDVIALYLSEGDLEGIRGDLAFAQAILETGYFTNSDTARSNFAGIAHYDDTDAGHAFASPALGVRAHVQLLHKFAAGNDVQLEREDVAPNAGARAVTWSQLAGTWATDASYWTGLSTLYQSMTYVALGRRPDDASPIPDAPCDVSQQTVVGGYTLPVDRHWYDEHPVWFTKPHHDYPAADIPVPSGTAVYTLVAGSVSGAPDGGRCGTGVVIDGDDGAQYSYCHGLAGERRVSLGDRVEAGQVIMLSGNTGNSTGPHLHLGIRVQGQQRCPQNLLVAVAEGRVPDVQLLPGSGCSE